MSDAPQGEGWWQAVDHRWYPPHLHPQCVEPAYAHLPPPPTPSNTASPPRSVRMSTPPVTDNTATVGMTLVLASLIFPWLSATVVVATLSGGEYSAHAWIVFACGLVALIAARAQRPLAFAGSERHDVLAAAGVVVAGVVAWVWAGYVRAVVEINSGGDDLLDEWGIEESLEDAVSVRPGPGLVLATLGAVLLVTAAYPSVTTTRGRRWALLAGCVAVPLMGAALGAVWGEIT